MKKALLSKLEPGRVCDVCEIGNEFEVSADFYWVECPDDVTREWTYDVENSNFNKFDILTQPGFINDGYRVARAIAYGSIGDQLDMIYKELSSTGTLSLNGPWAEHVSNVKDQIPKDNPQAVLEWYRQQNS
jgi:hypothetical protein